jgi:hypothetical protein
MAVFRVLDDRVVSEVEFQSLGEETRELTKGAALLAHREALARDVREIGEAAPRGRPRLASATRGAPIDFTPIGLGVPLSILIAHVYTGKYPRSWTGGDGKKSMLVTSACKDHSVFNATPRALNFLREGVKPKDHFNAPPANTNGTRVVYYSPAVTSDALVATFEIAFHDMAPDLIKKLGEAAGAAAGIPVFLPATGYLLAGSQLLKLASNVVGTWLNGDAVMSETVTFNFATAGEAAAEADFRIVAPQGFDASGLRYEPGLGLVSRQTGDKYDDDKPYIVLIVDGAQKKNLETFAPTVATAGILERFYRTGDATSTSIDSMIDAMKVVSDMRFREQAIALAADIRELPANTPAATRQRMLDEFTALTRNIGDQSLRPATPT